MTRDQAEKNLKVYFWFRLLSEPIFWGSILITYVKAVSGMSLSRIYYMEAVCVMGMIFLQVPMGALADMIGRKKTIIIGLGFFVAEAITFASACNEPMIWIGNMFWAVGLSLISGADSALLQDTLKVLDRENEFKKIEGRASAYRLAFAAVGSLFSGWLAQNINLRLPISLDAALIGINFIVACAFMEPPGRMGGTGAKRLFNLMKVSLLFVANHRQVKWVIGFFVLITVVSKLWFFTYNPYFESVGLPLSHYGLVFFSLNLVAAVSSYFAHSISRRLGDFASVVIMLALIALSIMAMGIWVAPALAWFVLFQNLVRGYLNPFMGQFLQNYLDSENRATVASVQSASRAFVEVLALGAFGWVLKIYSLPTCLVMLGLICLICGAILVFYYAKIFKVQKKSAGG